MDLSPLDISAIDLFAIDRKRLTWDARELVCHVCKVRAEPVSEELQPERIRCPQCGMIGIDQIVLATALRHDRLQKIRNTSRAFLRGVHQPDLASDTQDYLNDVRTPLVDPVPAFVFRQADPGGLTQ